MSTVECDILKAKEVILDNSFVKPDYSSFDKIYSFTNENLIGCFNTFNIDNKDCLTVLGSSDQAFDLMLRNAKSIDTFDINPLTKYFFDLKKAALLSDISIEEYIDFFHMNIKDDYKTLFNKNIEETLGKVMKYLSGDSLIFWDALYPYMTDKKHIKSNPLFYKEFYSDRFLKNAILYLSNNDSFMSLKTKIKEQNISINFINSNITELKYKLNKKYDFMYFSNIIEYSSYIFPKSRYRGFDEFIKMCFELFDYLKIDGEAMLGMFFMYDYFNGYCTFKKCSDIYPKDLIEKFDIEDASNLDELCSLDDNKTYDTCYVYKKK